MMTDQEFATHQETYDALQRFAGRYRADEAMRARISGGDYSDLYAEVPADAEVRIVTQTPDTYYMLMPEDPNRATADRTLESVAGGSTTGSASSVFTASSFPSTLGCGSSAGSASSAEV